MLIIAQKSDEIKTFLGQYLITLVLMEEGKRRMISCTNKIFITKYEMKCKCSLSSVDCVYYGL